jgi:hypothetical protein
VDHTQLPPNQPETTPEAEARRLIAAAYEPDHATPTTTAYRDPAPVPAYGTAPPVRQQDRRIVPEWAAGVAVASIGAGCGAALIGCGIYAATAGLAQISLAGVLAAAVPFLGAGFVAIAIGTAIRSARAAAPVTHHHYEGDVHQQTVQARSIWSRVRVR